MQKRVVWPDRWPLQGEVVWPLAVILPSPVDVIVGQSCVDREATSPK